MIKYKMCLISASFSLLLTISIKLSPNENWFYMFNDTWNSGRLCFVVFWASFNFRITTEDDKMRRRNQSTRKWKWQALNFFRSKIKRNFPPNFHFLFWSAPSFHFMCVGKIAGNDMSEIEIVLEEMKNRCGRKESEKSKRELEIYSC